MPVDESVSPSLEIAHVLFMDVVGYSKLPMDHQQSVLSHLMEAVRRSPHFMRAHKNGQLISLPTGDGMALVFFGDPEAPVRCAMELSHELRAHPDVQLRMGVHTGPVYRIADINANRNVSGGGINIAQRVMDCGDSGHILVSSAVAEVLHQLSGWNETLHDLGDAEVKHGLRVHVYNLYSTDAGNPSRPRNAHFGKTPSSSRGLAHIPGMVRPDELLGNTLGSYRVLRRIGSGGMGVIYEALDTRLGRHVALKLLPEQTVADDFALERFRREAALASTLTHPHVCTLYDIGEEAGHQYIVMELLDGQSLRDRMDLAPIEIQQVLDWMIQVTDALQFAHSQKIVHRDIKPANIFITKHGHAKVLDFGLAKLSTGPSSEHEQQLTSPGLVVGTLAYMSPEQARGEELDERTDIFSMGAVMYEMATGKTPFPGATTALVMDAILNREPMPPRSLNPAVPADLERIVDRCLEKDRRQRYQHVGQLCEELKTLKRSLDSSAVLTVATQAAASKRRKLTRLLIPTTAVLVLGIAAVVWLALRHDKPKPTPPPITTLTEPVASPKSVAPKESVSTQPAPESVPPREEPAVATKPLPTKQTKPIRQPSAPAVTAPVVPAKTPLPSTPQPATSAAAQPAPTEKPVPTPSIFTGHYAGRFVTMGVPDLLSTVILEEQRGVLRGCLHVARLSMAGGPFRGVASANMLMITVATPAGRLDMQGQVQDNEFRGNYVMYERTGVVWHGQFAFQRTNSDGLSADYQEATCTPN